MEKDQKSPVILCTLELNSGDARIDFGRDTGCPD
jgi:hypothetical protein